MMNLKTKNRPILHYYDIAPEVVAFSTTRKGGYSEGNYGEFNINPYCGDDINNVIKNKQSLCQLLEIEDNRLLFPHQTHDVEVRHISEDYFNLPSSVQQMIVDGVDALMTDVSGVCIGVSTADCIPIIIYDEAHHACCAVHAGWRGTVAKIVEKVIDSMVVMYHTDPSQLVVCIGPGISIDNFEVGEEVYNKFAGAGFDMKKISRMETKWHIDLFECNKIQLTDKGVNISNIHQSGICTYSNVDDYFSARRLGTDSGRIFTGIMIK